ncbi:hypothetical protein FS837_005182 [Tulasnella sp. UAMH 9824]|nr:hypothetical protein FS837_005182 [Tulasnella sp. UAMH 9824]
MDHMSQLPIELLAHVMFLSLDRLIPRDRLIRTETLRLVNKTWQATIDSTPDLWECIPNEPHSLETTKGWIQKSGQVPLHIVHTNIRPFEGYMQLVAPHIHRWRKVEIATWYDDVWQYFSEPAPMLEELLISECNISSNHIPFKGITPSLSSVELVRITFPENISFLRNLKELRLEPRGYWSDEGYALSKYCDILEACPDLEKLQLDAYAITYPLDPRPVLLAKLSSFSIRGVHQWKPDCLEAILDMITAPSLSDFYIPFGQNWVPPTLNPFSPLSTDLLRNWTRYQLSISHGQFRLSTDVVQDKAPAAPNVTFDLLYAAKSGEVALKLFQSFANAAPSSAPVDITLDQSGSTESILNYLSSTAESVDGISRYPLPQLHSIQLNIKGKSRVSHKDLLINLAQVRQDVPTIKVYDSRNQKKAGIRVSQWNPETSSFVSI